MHPYPLPELPVTDVLVDLSTSLKNNNTVILRAPTGAGKTTLVPLYLHLSGTITGKILVLEPRRLATFTAANRMADIIGEPIGKTVGYRMQMDSRISTETVIEVVTEGILTRMIQDDPELSGVGLIIFDEFHERSLQADLGLAFSLQSQALRDNPLKLLIMSATLNTEVLANALSAPVVISEGFGYPVATHYLEKPLKNRQFYGLCQSVVSLILSALSKDTGSLLVFLPGAGEIRKVQQLLDDSQLPANTDIFPLFGSMALEKQKQAIQATASGRRKIVLATTIAETSLTIEGIRIVVDSGISRRAVYNPVTGMNRLETRRVSLSSADQRKGRAGRLESGICYRLWTVHEHQQLEVEDTPEIQVADLTAFCLELHAWGCPSPAELFWLNPPPAYRYQQSIDLLQQLNALAPAHTGNALHINAHGKAMAKLGAHPRIANMLLLAEQHNSVSTGCRLAAILQEPDIFRGNQYKSANIETRLHIIEDSLSTQKKKPELSRIIRLARTWEKRLNTSTAASTTSSTDEAAQLLLAAYPDRLAKRRSNNNTYLTASGLGAELPKDDPLAQHEFLVIPEMGGHSGRSNATIFLACPVDKNLIYDTLTDQIEEVETIQWDSRQNRVIAFSQDKLGALVIEQQPLAKPAPEKVASAMSSGIKDLGLQCLPWTKSAQQLQSRMVFIHHCQRKKSAEQLLPDVSSSYLENHLAEWLTPYLSGITRPEQLQKLDMTAILSALLSWEQQQILDQEAPATFKVPSGSTISIHYTKPEEPTLSVRLQELFGLESTPVIGFNTTPLTIELLSPAHRPVQITQDLSSFWKNTYHDVRKDLKGRYPRHWWPDNPWDASPTSRCKPKR